MPFFVHYVCVGHAVHACCTCMLYIVTQQPVYNTHIPICKYTQIYMQGHTYLYADTRIPIYIQPQPEGFKAMNELVEFYMENAAILRKTFTDMGFTVYGGTNAPYVWVGFPGRCWCAVLWCCTSVECCTRVVWMLLHTQTPTCATTRRSLPTSRPGRKSWDVFAEILEKCNIVTTPGSGFGPAGEGFVRASAFGTRENVLEAVERFKKAFGQ